MTKGKIICKKRFRKTKKKHEKEKQEFTKKRKMEEKTYDILDSFKIPENDISGLSEKILQLLNKDNV